MTEIEILRGRVAALEHLMDKMEARLWAFAVGMSDEMSPWWEGARALVENWNILDGEVGEKEVGESESMPMPLSESEPGEGRSDGA